MTSIACSTRDELEDLGSAKDSSTNIMGPKDISATWHLNQVRLRTWDHFLVVARIEGRELKTKKCVKGWAGGLPFQKQRISGSKNLCSVHEKSMAKPLHATPKMVRDWSFYMTGWWALLRRFKPSRLRQGTGANFVYLWISGRGHPTQQSAGTL